ncbi:valine--tRNA ligase [Ponticaulis sp.]|uniref:valine--tRNA ligase n=1 Tax=Ponticaulis sp. TaxID=2020902 RepID=UPI000B68649F|nr:valine--tRNA ligase [Ponticaulis sp.]MAI92083.1 valine--tRNA ligase [Ponticaulis sp.]OUX96258.1 MAG: valine--tRNA ligase [Hyphomonadaceae bacterium TMED5]|tara:strand:+ start:52641 stop:55619 length:2979 start_codon:yes stop_codon:yes gene_type:complete
MIDQHFNPAESEERIYKKWEEAGAFAPDMDSAAEPYAIVIPPPNVTGVLHMGHALNHTLQDILIRFERMRGKKVLWQPGTDHAGIATQMVVERKLAAEGNQDRRSMGREAFLEKVWEWKAESGGKILEQDKRLGSSCDWSRERFTMDEGLSRAVLKTFIELYNDGLIYRDKRLVNWDPQFQTAISDLEVENKEVAGHMWHFKYPLAGGETYTYVEKDEDGNVTFEEERDYISIATTRPETMLGDGAVAVHPKDERYAAIVGKLCEIPVGPKESRRLIPIITDDYPDPDFGSGAVKITGAHDFNDYGVARRNKIPLFNLMDDVACMRADGLSYEESAKIAAELAGHPGKSADTDVTEVNLVPEELRGLDRYECRKKVIDAITAEGLAVMVTDDEGNSKPLVEDKKIMQPFGDRSGVVIEPMLTDQWYVDAKTLAQPAIEAVRKGDTSFVPENWSKTYFQWLDNIEPWCISRQLWWGHRIPAWYGPEGDIFVAENAEAATKAAEEKYGKAVELVQDEDVLDTWFSSALWPFSTIGWPDQTKELDTFYPGAVLVTGFDIIFFWVARMMMFGLHFMKEIPFHDVYIHALVLDETGKKMSKSEGNVLDPLDIISGCELQTLIDKRLRDSRTTDKNRLKQIEQKTKNQFPEGIPACGADALRFTLASQAAQGRDIRLSIDRIVGYRNFGTKLWNAARFCQMNECTLWEPAKFDPMALKQPINQWIVGEMAQTVTKVTEALEGYRFNDASTTCYRFIWNTFCDWYVELIKPLLNGEDDSAKAETRQTAAWVLDETLKMLHPFMPFITEELWEQLAEFGPGRDQFLMLQAYPAFGADLLNEKAAEEVDWVIEFITEIRGLRGDLNVPAGAKLRLALVAAEGDIIQRTQAYAPLIERLARLEHIAFESDVPDGAVQMIHRGTRAALVVSDALDISAEKERLSKELSKIDGEIMKISKKLGNENFMAKAPAEVVEEQRSRMAEYGEKKEKLSGALQSFEGMS